MSIQSAVLVARSACLCAMIAFLVPSRALSQVSFYSSFGYGYDQNPLYNYQLLSDQTKTGYVEANYAGDNRLSGLALQYIGGLGLFNRFSQRDFYEHKLSGSYSFGTNGVSGDEPASEEIGSTASDSLQGADSLTAGDTSDTTTVKPPADTVAAVDPPDTVENFVGIGGMIGARHDKHAFEQFDNIAGTVSATYRAALSSLTYLRLTNMLSGRSFTHLDQLSHIDDIVSFELGGHGVTWTSFGMNGSIGEKYYTVSQYDTTQFERTRSFIPKGQGKGKTGATLVPSQKRIFIQPQGNGTIQTVANVFFGNRLGGVSTFSSFTYRWNLKSATRYLALTSGASLFSKNIYDDVFSYQGPAVSFTANGKWIAQLQWVLTGEYQLQSYGVPALNLIGQTIAGQRTDKHAAVELYVSEPLASRGGTQLEIFVDATWVSNRSNDEYNNFASSAISGGLGIDF